MYKKFGEPSNLTSTKWRQNRT